MTRFFVLQTFNIIMNYALTERYSNAELLIKMSFQKYIWFALYMHTLTTSNLSTALSGHEQGNFYFAATCTLQQTFWNFFWKVLSKQDTKLSRTSSIAVKSGMLLSIHRCQGKLTELFKDCIFRSWLEYIFRATCMQTLTILTLY